MHYALANLNGSFLCTSARSEPHTCPLNPFFANRQLFHEAIDAIRLDELRLSSAPASGRLVSNLLCLHQLGFTRVQLITLTLNPFQFTETVPELRACIIRLCQHLKRCEIDKLVLECDGTVPRTKAPFDINEIDLDRGPLYIVLLLQPFRMLAGVRRANVRIFGGPLTSLWSKDTALQNFAGRLQMELEGRCGTQDLELSSIFKIQRQLESEGLIWHIDRLQDVYHLLTKSAYKKLPFISTYSTVVSTSQ